MPNVDWDRRKRDSNRQIAGGTALGVGGAAATYGGARQYKKLSDEFIAHHGEQPPLREAKRNRKGVYNIRGVDAPRLARKAKIAGAVGGLGLASAGLGLGTVLAGADHRKRANHFASKVNKRQVSRDEAMRNSVGLSAAGLGLGAGGGYAAAKSGLKRKVHRNYTAGNITRAASPESVREVFGDFRGRLPRKTNLRSAGGTRMYAGTIAAIGGGAAVANNYHYKKRRKVKKSMSESVWGVEHNDVIGKAFSFRPLGAKKIAQAPGQAAGVQRGLAMVNNPKVGNVSRVASQKFAAPTPRLGVQKRYIPILSPAGRSLRVGQTRAAEARGMFGGRASRQFAGPNVGAGKRAAGDSRFGQSQGGGAVPRGAGAAAHSAASGLRNNPSVGQTPAAGRHRGTYRMNFGSSTGGAHRAPEAGRHRGQGFLAQNKKAIGIGVGAGAVGAGGAAYGHNRVKKDFSMATSVWGVDHGYDGEIAKRSQWSGTNNAKRDKRHAENAAIFGVLPSVGVPAAGIYAGSKAKRGRGAAVGLRVTGRQFAEGVPGGIAGGAALGAVSRGRLAAVGSTAGALAGSSHGAYAATRNAGRRGDLNKS